MEEVRLSYKRVRGERSLGRIVLRQDDKETVLVDFDGISWVPMLSHFARELQAHPSAKGVIQRTDREGLAPFYLGEAELALFRSDPAAAIRSMTFHVSKPARSAEPVVNAMEPMPAAIDALAETFGDLVFLRVRQDPDELLVECPVRGTWQRIEGAHISLPNNKMLLLTEMQYLPYNWVAVPTLELLFKGCSQYFIPRQWNKTGAWISWEDLNTMLKNFEKERESA